MKLFSANKAHKYFGKDIPNLVARSKGFASFLTIVAIVSLWPFSGAEDVSNARDNILIGDRTDFWGGFSQFFYSTFGLSAPIWHITLGLFHSSLVWVGTILTINTLSFSKRERFTFTLLLSIHFLATIFVLNLSRDSSILAFAWIAISLLFRFFSERNLSLLGLILGLFFLMIGLSFRPWLAIGLSPLILGLFYFSVKFRNSWIKYLVLFFVLFFISLGPLILDLSSKRLMNLKASFPEQQVMILDIASLVCLSPEKSVQSVALATLKPISNSSELSRERLCGQFYPQNWGSPIFYSQPSDPALHIIEVNDFETYKTIRNSWLKLIWKTPIQYIQIKIFQISQLFLAGDSINFSLKSFRDIPLIPYEILKALRVFSLLPFLLLLYWLTFSRKIQIDLRIRFLIYLAYILTIIIVAIAFIGDNQRYISWLAMLILFTYLNAPEKLTKVVS